MSETLAFLVGLTQLVMFLLQIEEAIACWHACEVILALKKTNMDTNLVSAVHLEAVGYKEVAESLR